MKKTVPIVSLSLVAFTVGLVACVDSETPGNPSNVPPPVSSPLPAKTYDNNGFNSDGIHKDTGTPFDPYGFDVTGIHQNTKTNYDANGFNQLGMHKVTKTKFDTFNFDRDRYDPFGFDFSGTHKVTGTAYDLNGFDVGGIHKATGLTFDSVDLAGNPRGYNRFGFDPAGYDKSGYDKNGFDKGGIHKATGTKYNLAGVDRHGFDVNEFSADGIHKSTRTKYDPKGYDKNRFNAAGEHELTKTKYDPAGYDVGGFDISGLHGVTGTPYNPAGFDRLGFNKHGFNDVGIHNGTGTRFNGGGFNVFGMHTDTSTRWNLLNRNIDGYHKFGTDAHGKRAGTEVLPTPIAPVQYYLAATSKEYRLHLHYNTPGIKFSNSGAEMKKILRAQYLCQNAGFTEVVFYSTKKIDRPFVVGETLEPVDFKTDPTGFQAFNDTSALVNYNASYKVGSPTTFISAIEYAHEALDKRDGLYRRDKVDLPHQVFVSVQCR